MGGRWWRIKEKKKQGFFFLGRIDCKLNYLIVLTPQAKLQKAPNPLPENPLPKPPNPMPVTLNAKIYASN